jgi:hypothetical protein
VIISLTSPKNVTNSRNIFAAKGKLFKGGEYEGDGEGLKMIEFRRAEMHHNLNDTADNNRCGFVFVN